MHPLPSKGVTADSVPIRPGTPDQFHTLRSALQQLHYDEASICSRTGAGSIFGFKSKVEGRDTGREVNDSLDALIHLLMDGEIMAADQVSTLLPPGLVATLTDLGVLG